MLSPAQIEAREGKLTASRVKCLMDGDEAGILSLWREMVDDPAFQPEDLSAVWPVQLGSCTEWINLEWFERKHGPVTRRGEVVVGDPEWMAATLDGFSEKHGCPVECKHVGGREPLTTIIERYQPQMQWQMLVTKSDQCALSVIEGANEPIVEFIPAATAYQIEMVCRADAFMQCVRTLTPPITLAPVAAPVPTVKTYDMHGNNQWASEALSWLDNRKAAKDFAASEKAIKSLIPPDAIRCHGYQIEVKRDRAGRLSIKEIE